MCSALAAKSAIHFEFVVEQCDFSKPVIDTSICPSRSEMRDIKQKFAGSIWMGGANQAMEDDEC